MDFASLSAYGRSTTSTAWATNPVRKLLWWLIAPYFRAAGAEISHEMDRSRAGLDVLADRVRVLEGRAQDALGALGISLQTVEGSLRNLEHSLSNMEDRVRNLEGPGQDALRNMLEASLGNKLNYHVVSLQKENRAITFRLASLEDSTSAAEQELIQYKNISTSLADKFREFNEILDLSIKNEAASRNTISDLTEWLGKINLQVQDLNLQVQKVNLQVQEDGVRLAKVQPSVQSLTERLDGMARGPALAAGDRVAISAGGLVMVASPRGVRLLVRQHDHIGGMILDGREWEPHVREAIERAANPDRVAIDVGAYIGIHTLSMARWFRTVHAFEPQRIIYQMLCGNLALNGCSNVATHNVAVYDRPGSVQLAPEEHQDTPVSIRNGQPDYENLPNAAALAFDFFPQGGDVPAVTIDSMALTNVGLIKVDAQGADLRVLMGASETLLRSRPVVLFEWERDLGLRHGATLDDFLKFFDNLNYSVTMLHDTTPGRQADYIAEPR